jgi:hypothetical protein
MTDLSPLPKFRATVAGTGIPLVGGQLFTYAAGTVPNPGNYQSTYRDSIGTPNTNPIILNSYGECDLWLGDLSYKFVLQDSLGNTLWTVDNVKSIGITGIEAIVDAAIAELFIENFAAISSTPVVAGKVYYLKEYHAGTGKGGGELEAYTSSDTPNNGTIFASGTSGIRLKRINYTTNLYHFGAKNEIGYDNTSAINAAIAAAPWDGDADGSGYTVYVDSGAFEHDPIVVNRPVTFKGAGKYSTYFIKKSAGTGFTMQLDTSASAGFEDIGFVKKSGFSDSVSGHGVDFGSGRSYAKNIYAAGHGGVGILISESNSSQFVGLESVLNGSHGVAIIGRASPNNNANGLIVINIDSRVNGGSGLYLEQCFANTIVGPTCQANARYGIELGTLNQLHNIIGIYSEANTLGAGLFGAGSNGCRIQYNIVEDANPTDLGANNSVILQDDDTFGSQQINPIKTPSVQIGNPTSGTLGVLKISDSGTQYEVTLEGTGGDATLEFKSAGVGILTSKFQKLYEDSANLTLLNSWVLDAAFGTPAIYKDSTGRCYLSGTIKNGTAASGTVIATVAAAYRPAVRRRLATANTAGTVFLHVETNGDIKIDSGTNAIIALDGLNWRL